MCGYGSHIERPVRRPATTSRKPVKEQPAPEKPETRKAARSRG